MACFTEAATGVGTPLPGMQPIPRPLSLGTKRGSKCGTGREAEALVPAHEHAGEQLLASIDNHVKSNQISRITGYVE